MKKLAMALAMTGAMAMASVCAAAGEGALLSKDQKAVEAFFAGLNGAEGTTYASTTAGLVPELKTKINAEAFANLQKGVKEKLGNCQDVKFRAFEHFNDGDRLVYLGKYSKEPNVVMNFVCNPAGKIMSFGLTPVKPQAPKPAQPAQAPAKK